MTTEGDTYWFEAISPLNRSIKLMERLPEDVRDMVAKEALNMAKSLRLTQGGAGMEGKEGGYDRVLEMMKVKSSERWFGRSSVMVKALSEIHTLSDKYKHEVGLKMLLCLQAIDQYNSAPAAEGKEGETGDDWGKRVGLSQVIRSIFAKELEVFEEQGEQRKRERIEREAALRAEEEESLRLLEEEWAKSQPAVLVDLELPPDTEGSAPHDLSIEFKDNLMKLRGLFSAG